MEQGKIRELLNRFYEGSTSEEEEAQLKEYLSDPSLLSSARTEFGYIPGMAPEIPEPSAGFEERLRELPFGSEEQGIRSRVIRIALGTAAAAAVLTGAWLLFDISGKGGMQDTYKDPEIAMAEVKNILLAVSSKMTEGTAPLSSINSMKIAPETLSGFGKINSVVEDNLSKLRYLDQLTGSQKKTDNN